MTHPTQSELLDVIAEKYGISKMEAHRVWRRANIDERLRDMFAIHALNAFLVSGGVPTLDIAKEAWAWADKMLEERAK